MPSATSPDKTVILTSTSRRINGGRVLALLLAWVSELDHLVIRQAPEPTIAKAIAAFLPPGGSSLLTQMHNTQPEGEVTQHVKVSFPIRPYPALHWVLALMGNQPNKLTSPLATLAPC